MGLLGFLVPHKNFASGPISHIFIHQLGEASRVVFVQYIELKHFFNVFSASGTGIYEATIAYIIKRVGNGRIIIQSSYSMILLT